MIVRTAISIPDTIFEEAARLAKSRGWSRSELYANAVTAYVNSERFLGVREKLDAVYGDDAEDSAIDPLPCRGTDSLPAQREMVNAAGRDLVGITWRAAKLSAELP